MIGWAGTNCAARLDLEENSLTRVKNVHIFNVFTVTFEGDESTVDLLILYL